MIGKWKRDYGMEFTRGGGERGEGKQRAYVKKAIMKPIYLYVYVKNNDKIKLEEIVLLLGQEDLDS